MTETTYPENTRNFLSRHKLPATYGKLIKTHFSPIADAIATQRHQLQRPLLVGINGCQGSGKTTLADALVMLLESQHQLKAIALSIDDFYLTRSEREQLAKSVHPLFKTRGVPGTHDIKLANKIIEQLTSPDHQRVAIPRFDKAIDDRSPAQTWESISAPVDIVILEGWCVGSSAEAETNLLNPVNSLEASEDAKGIWRHYANNCLRYEYQTLFKQVDLWVMLKAPSFDTVYRWRMEQENKLREKKTLAREDMSQVMSASEVERFIRHYQRITENTLKTLPDKVNFLLTLDENRNIVDHSQPQKMS